MLHTSTNILTIQKHMYKKVLLVYEYDYKLKNKLNILDKTRIK